MITVVRLRRAGIDVWCRTKVVDGPHFLVLPLKGLPFDENAWWGRMMHGHSQRLGRPVLWTIADERRIVPPEHWPPEVCTAVALEALDGDAP